MAQKKLVENPGKPRKTGASKKSAKSQRPRSDEPPVLREIEERELPPLHSDRIRILSWNVNGIRAVAKKGFFDWLNVAVPDILCLQETRARTVQLKSESAAGLLEDPSYCWYWSNAEKGGYSGTATFSRIRPLSAGIGFEHDSPGHNFNSEGRLVVTEFPWFVLWNVYFPNGGRGAERVQYKLDFYDKCLLLWEEARKQGKKLILCGDFNTAHREIDLARPKENEKVSGFLPEERAFLDKMESLGYIDIFRRYDPSPGKYTFWDPFRRARERNIGWRIDYFWIGPEVLPMIQNAWIEMDVVGSDHCPVGLEVKISGC